MINTEIVIKEIQYEKSFEKLFPMGMEKCRKMDHPNLAVRFLVKMGDASMTAALGILNLADERSKNRWITAVLQEMTRSGRKSVIMQVKS